MTTFNLSVSILLMLAQAIALADGGAVELRKEAGAFVITVFTSPAPLSSGPVDVSLLLQNRNGLEPLLDADVSLLLRAGFESRVSSAADSRAGAEQAAICGPSDVR